MSGEWEHLDARLLLFAKAPVPGRVKSRLRPVWGARGACTLYQQLFRRTLETVLRSGAAPVEVWAAPSVAHPWLRARSREYGVPLRVQPPGDLGERMAAALNTALEDHPYALIIGADCAGLTAGHVSEAVSSLAAGDDAVFCPAHDGGYLLVGMRRVEFEAFRAIPWGTADVMRATRQRMRRLGWRVTELTPARDVDRQADVRFLRHAGVLQGPGVTPGGRRQRLPVS